MKVNEKSYNYCKLWKEGNNNIVFACYSPNLIITRQIAEELVNDRLNYTNNEPHFVIIDFTNIKSVSKEARDFMNSTCGGLKGIKCGAFLSNSVVTKTFINLYLKINKPVIPTRFFTNKNEALEWLSSIQQ